MSSNGSTLFDEDGDTPDWIELYNPGMVANDLGGYGITDNPLEDIYSFSTTTCASNVHALVAMIIISSWYRN
jgi:hypothetical protein